LFILINPFVEVGLQEVDLLCILQQSWPELLSRLLLSQNHLDILGGVVDLALLWINLSVEFELDVVCPLEGLGVACEGESLWLEVELKVCGLDIRNGDGEVDQVLCWLRLV